MCLSKIIQTLFFISPDNIMPDLKKNSHIWKIAKIKIAIIEAKVHWYTVRHQDLTITYSVWLVIII